MKKLLVDLVVALLVKLVGYFATQWKRIRKEKKIIKDQDSKTQDIINAELDEEIRAAHRANKL